MSKTLRYLSSSCGATPQSQLGSELGASHLFLAEYCGLRLDTADYKPPEEGTENTLDLVPGIWIWLLTSVEQEQNNKNNTVSEFEQKWCSLWNKSFRPQSVRIQRKAPVTISCSRGDVFKLLLLSNQNPKIFIQQHDEAEKNQQILTFEKLQPEDVSHFCSANDLNDEFIVHPFSLDYLINQLILLSTNWIQWKLIVAALVECILPHSSSPPLVSFHFLCKTKCYRTQSGTTAIVTLITCT